VGVGFVERDARMSGTKAVALTDIELSFESVYANFAPLIANMTHNPDEKFYGDYGEDIIEHLLGMLRQLTIIVLGDKYRYGTISASAEV
jgi:hypothetical protein